MYLDRSAQLLQSLLYGRTLSIGVNPYKQQLPAPGHRYVMIARIFVVLFVSPVPVLICFDTEKRVPDQFPVIDTAPVSTSAVGCFDRMVVNEIGPFAIDVFAHDQLRAYPILCAWIIREFFSEASEAVVVVFLLPLLPVGPALALYASSFFTIIPFKVSLELLGVHDPICFKFTHVCSVVSLPPFFHLLWVIETIFFSLLVLSVSRVSEATLRSAARGRGDD